MARVLRSLVLMGIALGLAAAPVAHGNSIEWKDPGFETSADLVGGPWITGSAKKNDAHAGDTSNWTLTLEAPGGNPNRHVYVRDEPNAISGFAFVGQYIEPPPGAIVTSADLGVDALRYCPGTDRRGAVGFALFRPNEWAKIHPVAAHPPKLNQINPLWSWVPSIVGPDITSWADPAVHVARSDANLTAALQSHTGERLIMSAFYLAAHTAGEWSRLDNFQASVQYTPRSLMTLPWHDPGFDTTTDFTTGPWEVREARDRDTNNSEWAFTLPGSGGNPGRYVSIDDNPNSTTGYALLGQQIMVPESREIVTVDLELDAQRYCPGGNRAGAIGFALFTDEEWDKMDPALSGMATPHWNTITKLWTRQLWSAVGADYLLWKHGVLSALDAANLTNALNAHKGEDLVLGAYYMVWHPSGEWCKIDNFEFRMWVTPEPTTMLLFGGGLAVLAARRRRRAR